ncbi:hypothetical protein [Niallia circulans]|uniref:hypothetical protein n=1 Tax=Niallia circulans TaxID=1397 RepID=UPI0039796627
MTFPLITNVKWRKKSVLASVAVSGLLLTIATLIITLSLGLNTSSQGYISTFKYDKIYFNWRLY